MTTTRVGLVGAGGIARSHLPAWLALGADVHVHATEGASDLVAEHPGAVLAPTLDDLLDHADVVDVVTPTPRHREHAETALRAGKDVVCEKPLTRTHADAVALADLATELGRHLYPAHVVRYFPEYAAMRDAVVRGDIGTPAVSRYSRTGAFPLWADWFAADDQSGGVVLDLMIHDLDIARWVSGEVTEVYATRTRETADDGSPLTVAQAVLTHEGGAISHVRGVWGPPATTFRTAFHVAGDRGVLRYDTREEESLVLDLDTAQRGGAMLPDLSLVESPYLTELRDFAQAIAGGPAPRVTAHDGVVAVGLALAALESIDRGTPVVPEEVAR